VNWPINPAGALRLAAPVDRLKLLSAASILALIGAALAVAAYRYPPPSLGLTVAAGLALTGMLALAVARYDAAVALGLALFGVQAVEPAPADFVFAIVIAVAAVTGRFEPTRVPLTIFVTLGSFLFLNVISTVGAISPSRAAFFFSITLYLAVFSVWLVGFLDSTRRARLVVLAYLGGAVISALLGVGALFGPLPAEDQLLYTGQRARALFDDVNVFGPFMVPILLIVLQETLEPRLIRWRRPIMVAIIFVLAAAILFSYSRAAWLNTAVAVIVFFGVLSVRRGGLRRLLPALLILAVTLVAGSFIVSASGSEQFLSERATLQAYDVERFTAQEAGIQLAEGHPLGIGPGQFEPFVQYSAHSTFIRAFAEQGILGLVAFVGLALSTLVLAGRNAVLGRHTYGIGSAALFAAWSGLLVNSFFVDTLHWRHLWLVAALIWIGALRGEGDSPIEAGRRQLASSSRYRAR
jgi:O-antigen ligase